MIPKAIRSIWRRIEVWYETLDCREDEYFGYGDDRTAMFRMLAKSLKRRLDPECTQSLEPEVIVEVPSRMPPASDATMDVPPAPMPMLPAVPVSAPVSDSAIASPPINRSAARHLPFALPDEIYHDEHPPALHTPVRVSHPARQWVAVGITAIAINAVSQMFTVQPLQSKVERLSSELSQARSAIENLVTETKSLKARNTEFSAALSQPSEGERQAVGKSVSVPDPYGPVTFTQWKREAARTDSRRPAELD